MTVWLAFILGGAGTFFMRASFLGFFGDGLIPPALVRALKYVGPAVFAAIVLPRVVGDDGLGAFAAAPDARIIAAVIAGAVGWKTRHVPLTLGVGMVALWLCEWLGLG